MFVLQTRGFCIGLWRTQKFTREGRLGDLETWRGEGVFRPPRCHFEG